MSYTINHVVFVGGNITKDAELRYTNGGSVCASFSVAMNYKKKSGDDYVDAVDFFKVVLWGKLADAIGKLLVKGKKVAIEGRLSQNRWETPEGKSMSTVEIVASNVVLLGSPQSERAERDNQEQDYQPQYQQAPPDYQPQSYQLPPTYQPPGNISNATNPGSDPTWPRSGYTGD